MAMLFSYVQLQSCLHGSSFDASVPFRRCCEHTYVVLPCICCICLLLQAHVKSKKYQELVKASGQPAPAPIIMTKQQQQQQQPAADGDASAAANGEHIAAKTAMLALLGSSSCFDGAFVVVCGCSNAGSAMLRMLLLSRQL
jgi:hypothetical protein